ncbi:helix-turn-helix transcriptional regulator [Achromobacter aloeverae]|uniref:HTH luxR-type domain-containing protein n=1 Tax=Achromobacter aloeverae TaxID=1750518 RepID=A0A4Q1HFD6_9BURK|nr:hypothetical protein [Achromobacter aloeverae]RXN85322.1 hypothetical protein C7R54_22800 [Achromobacter aloeverae]
MLDPQTVIGQLYDAVMDEDAFHPAVAACGQLIGQSHGVLLAWSGQATDMPVVASHFSSDPDRLQRYLADYAAYYHLLDPTKERWHAASEGDWLIDSRDLTPGRWNSQAFYHDFAQPLGMDGWAALKVAAARPQAGSPEWAFSLLRNKDDPSFSSEALALVNQVHPHLQRTLLLRQRYAELRQTAAMGLGVLDQIALPIWIAEADGRLRHANAAAEAAQRRPGFPLRQSGGRLLLPDGRLQAAWEALFHPKADHAAGGGLNVPAPDGHDVLLQVLALPAGLAASGSIERPLRMVVAHLRNDVLSPSWRAILAGLYGLTTAEIAVAADLARDHTVTEIAMVRGSHVETVRSQIKSILNKTGCRRQVTLVRLLDRLGVCAYAADNQPGSPSLRNTAPRTRS